MPRSWGGKSRRRLADVSNLGRGAPRSCAAGWVTWVAVRLLSTVVVTLAALAQPAAADPAPGSLSGQSYVYGDAAAGWPVWPVTEQHPIRGSFLDPRPGHIST